jgi:hypothetical protein
VEKRKENPSQAIYATAHVLSLACLCVRILRRAARHPTLTRSDCVSLIISYGFPMAYDDTKTEELSRQFVITPTKI